MGREKTSDSFKIEDRKRKTEVLDMKLGVPKWHMTHEICA